MPKNDKVAKPEMVFIEGGEVMMGCTIEQGEDCINNEKPNKSIKLNI